MAALEMLRLTVVAVALVACAMLLGASVYDSVVLAPNFHGAPVSLEHGRGFFHVTNPGTFFRVLSPFVQASFLLALILNWKPAIATRWCLAAAFLLAILGDVITFTFHYPRNAILFRAPLTNPAADFERTASEWAAGNYIRIGVTAAAAALALISLIRVARQTARHAA